MERRSFVFTELTDSPSPAPYARNRASSRPHLAHEKMLRRAAVNATMKSSAAAASAFARSASSASKASLYEVRTYDIAPASLSEYLATCDAHASTRKRLCEGFLAFFVTELGGDANEVTHVYRYSDYDERDATRARMARDADWQSFLAKTKPMIQRQRTEVFLEASGATKAAGLEANDIARRAREGSTTSASGVFELRRYQLELGYNPIPKLVELMANGLPSKIASDEAQKSSLVWMGYSDVGKLNQFVELWRYDTMQDHIRAREAARGASAWRKAVNDIAPMVQMFDTRLLRPASFSPIR